MEETTSNKAAMAAASSAIANDIRTIIKDVETLLKTGAAGGAEMAGTMRTQLEVMLLKLQAQLIELEKVAADRAVAAGKVADAYVHEHPWRAVGIAAGAGLIAGMLLCRR